MLLFDDDEATDTANRPNQTTRVGLTEFEVSGRCHRPANRCYLPCVHRDTAHTVHILT